MACGGVDGTGLRLMRAQTAAAALAGVTHRCGDVTADVL